jgi:Zn-dependent protease with chaperone function
MPTAYTPPRRLSPFVLPSATATQFVLLVVALLGGSIFVYNYLFVITQSRFTRAIDRCLSDANDQLAARADGHSVVVTYEACWRGISRTNSLLVLAGLAGLLLVAGLLYLMHPVLYRIRHRLTPLDEAAAPGLTEQFRSLAAQAGLRRPPTLLERPVLSVDAYSFGLRSKYVVLHKGLIRCLPARPDVVEAYLRHEIGHVRNADIALTQFVLAAWRAFILAALVPFIIIQGTHLSGLTVRVVVTMALILLVIYTGTLSVLRLREHYADVRATIADGPGGALGSLMTTAAERVRSGWRRHLRWHKRRHPSEDLRRDVVRDPARLLRLGLLPMLVAGLSLGIGTRSFPKLLSSLWTGADPSLLTFFTALFRLAVGILVAGVIGMAGWRAAVAAIVSRTRLPGATAPGITLAIGIVVGTSINNLETGTWWGQLTTEPVAGVITGAVLAAICVFFLQWSIVSAALWLEVTPSAQWRRQALWAVPMAGVMGGLLFTGWFDAMAKGPLTGLASLLNDLTNGQLAIAAIVALAWPLAAGLRRRRPSGPQVGLDGFVPSVAEPLPAWPVRPLLPLAAGAGAAVLFVIPMLLLRGHVADAIQGTIGQSLRGIASVLGVAVALQAAAAVVTAAISGVRQATLGALHGLAAVVVAGFGMLGVVTTALLTPVCIDKPAECLTRLNSPGWHQAWLILLIGAGALVATPLVWAVAWLARGLAELQGTPGWPRPPAPVHPRYARPRPSRADRSALSDHARLVIGTATAVVLAVIVLLLVLPPLTPETSEPVSAAGASTISGPDDRSLDGICSWWPQATLSAMMSGNASNNLGPDAVAIGRTVAGSDDALMHQIGDEIAASAAADDIHAYLVAVSALGYRCIQAASASTTSA